MHAYRSHTCGELHQGDDGRTVRLSGWVHRVRDHGGLLFIDLRDHYGLTQVVADPDSPAFKTAETLRSEWVIRVDGRVRRRPEGTENLDLPLVKKYFVIGKASRTAEETLMRMQSGNTFLSVTGVGSGKLYQCAACFFTDSFVWGEFINR